MIEELITRTLICIFGYAYPAFMCFKTLEKNKVGVPELRFWCQYWVIVALFSILERFLDIFVSWLPFYRGIKLIFYIYLWHPGTKGSSYFYDTLVQPYVAKHETKIDRGIAELKERAWNLALSYWYNCADMSSKKVLQCLQMLMTQCMNAALSRPQSQDSQNADEKEGSPPSPPSAGNLKKNATEKKRPPVGPNSKPDSSKGKQTEEAAKPEKTESDGDIQAARVRLRRINSKE